MQRRNFLKGSLLTTAGIMMTPMLSKAGWFTSGQNGVSSLEEIEKCFINPPGEFRAWVFWQWMNGNITKEGITLDLEAMKRMGIGGALCFNNAIGIPKGPVDYASDEWLNLTEFAVIEAERLGLKLMIHNSPGYSGTGGPWVTPEMSMQQLVWTETLVQNKGKIKLKLPLPFAKHDYYQDAYVIAYPSLSVEKSLMKDKLVKVLVNNIPVDFKILTDGNPETKIRLESKNNQQSSVLFEFSEAFEARSITILRKAEIPIDLFDGPRDYPPIFTLEFSNDGVNFNQVCIVNCPALREMDAPSSQSFEAVKAKYYRLSTSQPTWLSNVELHSGPRLPQWPSKINYSARVGIEVKIKEENQLFIDPNSVLNLSEFMSSDGTLNWKAPKGVKAWTILRIGHTTTGEEPAAHPDAGKGLEIDKFSKEALDFHFDKFLTKVIDVLAKHSSFRGVTTDSWEAGKQNWTVKLPEEFKQKRNYNILQWIPALTGRIVKNIEETERFLWDFRKTHADLLAENYSAYYAQRMSEKGLEYHAEPYGDGTFDSLQVGKHLSVPMSEFWTRYIYGSDMTSKQAASIAHAYAKPVVMAEAFTGMPLTSKWGEYPYSLKAEGDWFYTLGVNRLALHVFVHQPYTTGFPGMTMGPFGTHFDRNNTWTEQAFGWLNYTSRAQYVLQQGLAVIDICYYKGDNPASGVPDVYPIIPKGYKADVIGFNALHERLKIVNQKIVLPDGMKYQLMILPDLEELQPESVKKIKELVADGMLLIVEGKANKTLGRCFSDVDLDKEIVELYGDLDGITKKERNLGKGKIYWGYGIQQVLEKHQIAPDFLCTTEKQDATIHYYHKLINTEDVYFITNHKRRKEKVVVSLNVKNKQPYLWDAETGNQTKIAVFSNKNDRITIPLVLDPASSVFIIFKNIDPIKAITSIYKNDTLVNSVENFALGQANKYQSVQNNFTVYFWAKPDTFAHNNKSMVFHAPQAELLFGKDHAAIAVSVGQNIVRIYERTFGANVEVLAHETAISGYTHFAIVYDKGKPNLYINGELVKTGEKSKYTVHPGIETLPTDEQYSSYFEGNLSEIKLIDKSWNRQLVYEDYKKGLSQLNLLSDVKILNSSIFGTNALFTQNAKYKFNFADGKSKIIEIKTVKSIDISKEWSIDFPKNQGINSKIQLAKLKSLHLHSDFDIKHFSGTCIYQKTLQIEKLSFNKENRFILDLGRVEVIANVKVNGKNMQLLWKEPFITDITSALKVGNNLLEIEVTNLWPNRLVGDEYLPIEHEFSSHGFIMNLPKWYINNEQKNGDRKAFSVWRNFKKTDPLLESGLLGPVNLVIAVEKEI